MTNPVIAMTHPEHGEATACWSAFRDHWSGLGWALVEEGYEPPVLPMPFGESAADDQLELPLGEQAAEPAAEPVAEPVRKPAKKAARKAAAHSAQGDSTASRD